MNATTKKPAAPKNPTMLGEEFVATSNTAKSQCADCKRLWKLEPGRACPVCIGDLVPVA